MSEEKRMTEENDLVGKEITGGNDSVAKQVTTPAISNTNIPQTVKKTISTLTQTELNTLDYSDFSTPARMLALGKVLVKSKLVSGKKEEDVVVSLMAGKELGLPFVVSLSQIYAIDGKPSLGVHIIKGLILKHKILFKKLEDAAPIYTFVEVDKEGTVIKDNKGVPIMSNGTLEMQPPSTKKSNTPIGYQTTYEFTREVKMPSGKYREQTAKGSYSTIEANEAGLLERPNWTKYWRRMLDARAFSIGAREIADDIINGMCTPDELGANSFIDDKGTETIQYEEV